MRIKDFAERLSSAMVLLQMSLPAASGRIPETPRPQQRTLSIALARYRSTKGLQSNQAIPEKDAQAELLRARQSMPGIASQKNDNSGRKIAIWHNWHSVVFYI
jgi:hypothetical protein